MQVIDAILVGSALLLSILNMVVLGWHRKDINTIYNELDANHVFMESAAITLAAVQGATAPAHGKSGI